MCINLPFDTFASICSPLVEGDGSQVAETRDSLRVGECSSGEGKGAVLELVVTTGEGFASAEEKTVFRGKEKGEMPSGEAGEELRSGCSVAVAGPEGEERRTETEHLGENDGIGNEASNGKTECDLCGSSEKQIATAAVQGGDRRGSGIRDYISRTYKLGLSSASFTSIKVHQNTGSQYVQ